MIINSLAAIRDGLQPRQESANRGNLAQDLLFGIIVDHPALPRAYCFYTSPLMTIHTKWMDLMRQEAADAFQDTPPGGKRSQATFIDGQIKLMKADIIQTWAHFLYSQFTCIINRHFREYGCKTVVLAFDDKRYVPKAKAITQLKRRAGVEIIDFGENDVLPNDVPQWKEAIMNPHFKNKVIQLVCDSIPHLVQTGGAEGCKLVVDWQKIEVYEYDTAGFISSSTLEPASTVGEADIKFPYWMKRLQTPMLIEATDGDYIPISLGLKALNIHHPVAILKGKREEKHEFIDIDTLHHCIKTAFFRASRGKGHGHCWEIKLFITLLGLSGTDFTRNLPLVSPVKIWACLPLVAQTFSMAGDTNTIDQDQGKRIVELLYHEAFPKHIDPYSRASIWHQAQVSKLGAKNKALIPTDARIRCTLRNLNFLMAYWLEFRAPERIQDYGFRVSTEGTVEWDD